MQQTETTQPNLLDKLFTPKQLADRGILSLVTQWKERENGNLKFYRIGRKILYSEAQINGYLALYENGNEKPLAEINRPANVFGQ